jgi:hypothetical protein
MPDANPARTRPTHSGGAVISYAYLAGDLKLIGTIAGTLFVLLIALSFFL